MSAARKKKQTTKKPAPSVKGKAGKDSSLMDIMLFAETMANSLHSFFEVLDVSLYREFRDIATSITDMRAEIGKLQPDDLTSAHLPTAGEQLDAIVEATEEATNAIMESAEIIMAADTSDHEAYVAVVNDHVMKIFEACSFQDLTGQRIGKVVETLQHIEERVNGFANTIGTVDGEAFISSESKKRRERAKRLILNGPQDKGVAIEQNTVDEFFSSKD